MGRRSDRFNTGSRPRSERKTVLIVTEGERTEVQYLQGLAQYYRASGIVVRPIVCKGAGPDPSKVLAAAKSWKRADPDRYDEVWTVVDVDEHALLEPTLVDARRARIPMVVSNPCFEIWLLWHHEDCAGYRTGDQLRRRLRKLGHESKKVPTNFPYPNVGRAVDRALVRPLAHSVKGENPSSAMPTLIALLKPGA